MCSEVCRATRDSTWQKFLTAAKDLPKKCKLSKDLLCKGVLMRFHIVLKLDWASVKDKVALVKKELRTQLASILELDLARIKVFSIKAAATKRRRATTETAVDFEISPKGADTTVTDVNAAQIEAALKQAKLTVNGQETTATQVTNDDGPVPSPAPAAPTASGGSNAGVIVAAVIGVLVGVALIVGAVVVMRKRKAAAATKHPGGIGDVDL
jgi:hypothetical protein